MTKIIPVMSRTWVAGVAFSGISILLAREGVAVSVRPSSHTRQSSGQPTLSYSDEELEAVTRAEIANLPTIPRERLAQLAATHRPPQQWLDEDDDLF